MKEKGLMTSFYLANAADVFVTTYALHQDGFTELNSRAQDMINSGETSDILVAKIAITAVLTGIYALTAKEGNRWKWPVEKAMQIGNGLVWGAVVWNMVNVGLAFADKIMK